MSQKNLSLYQSKFSAPEQIGIHIKKSIAKLNKSKSKKFKQIPFVIAPITYNKFIFDDKFLIFGFIQIETEYRDYQSPFDQELVPLYEQAFSVSSTVMNYEKKRVELNLETKLQSGLKDFNFLIEYFSQIPNQDYQYLGQLLASYQHQCNQNISRYQDIQQKLMSRIINEEDILQSQRDFEQYLDEHIKRNYKDSDLIIVKICRVNYENQDMDIKKFQISDSLIDFMGVDIRKITKQKLLETLIKETRTHGHQRLRRAIDRLQLLQDGQISYQQPVLTIDGIHCITNFNTEILEWPQRPEYLGKRDIYAQITKIELMQEQLQFISETRESQNLFNNYQYSNLFDQFQNEVHSEIFLEKFYPHTQDSS
ncbi:hypothetical protein ABPG72_008332 [Tetrahymena utriculariae]